MLRSCADVVARCGSICDLRFGLHLFKVVCTCKNTLTHTLVDRTEGVYSSVNTPAVVLMCFYSYAASVPNHSVRLLLFNSC